MALTFRQQIVLSKLLKMHNRDGYMPTARELATELGIVQTGVVHHLDALEAKGAIRRTKGKARAMVVL